MIRRSILLVSAAMSVVAASVVFSSGTAAAETEAVTFVQDGTFWRLQTRAPVVDIPCQAPIPADRCGQVAPTAGLVNAPNVLDGNMVVGKAAGPPGEGEEGTDQFWIVSQPDLASLGSVESIEKMTLTYTVAPDARGDFGAPVIKGCNIVVPFGASEGSNPWVDRPEIDCSSAKVPAIVGNKITFDVTEMAQGWVDGKGFGLAIVPGLPGQNTVANDTSRRGEQFPFQISLINANKIDANRKPFPGRATGVVEYTLEADEFGSDTGDDVGEVLGLDDFGTDETGLGDMSAFDNAGGDFTSDGGFDDVAAAPPLGDGGNVAAGTGRLVGSDRPGFAWGLILVLPLLGLALWGAGSALGPLGDPVPVRQGGVARLVARRQAGRDNLP